MCLQMLLYLPLTTWVVVVLPIIFEVFRQPECLCLLVDPRFLEDDRFVQFYVFVVQPFPLRTFDALEDGLASFNGVSEGWRLCALLQATQALFHMKPRASPTATVLTEVKKTLPEGTADLESPQKAAVRPSASLRSFSSPAPSRTTCGACGLHHWKRFLCLLRIANPNRLVIVQCGELPQLLHHFQSASSLEDFQQHLHRTVTTLPMIRQEFFFVLGNNAFRRGSPMALDLV